MAISRADCLEHVDKTCSAADVNPLPFGVDEEVVEPQVSAFEMDLPSVMEKTASSGGLRNATRSWLRSRSTAIAKLPPLSIGQFATCFPDFPSTTATA